MDFYDAISKFMVIKVIFPVLSPSLNFSLIYSIAYTTSSYGCITDISN